MEQANHPFVDLSIRYLPDYGDDDNKDKELDDVEEVEVNEEEIR